MNNRSWIVVPEQDPEFQLAADLRARDPFGGRDCGYLEQMRPFIREFATPGALVFDPFCGFATTLLAAELEGRRGLGTEADAARAALARDRLDRHGCNQQEVITASCLDFTSRLPMLDLILTSVPYFGCRWPNEAGETQLYTAQSYSQYLDTMRRIFAALKPKLTPNGFIICMAENIRLGAHFVPLAFDVARLLSERFEMCDERVLVYEREGTTLESPAVTTNRAHEYALVARRRARAISIDATITTLTDLAKAFPDAIIYGSFIQAMTREGGCAPSDADVLVPYDLPLIARMAAWLELRNFRLLRWGSPIETGVAAAAAAESYYIRAERLTNTGELVVIDLSFEPGDATWSKARGTMRIVNGVPVSQ